MVQGQAVEPKWLRAVQVVALLQAVDQAAVLRQHADQAVALKWLLLADQAVQLQLLAVDQAVALKSLLAILAEHHPAIADVASRLASVVCSLRFSSAKAAAIQQ